MNHKKGLAIFLSIACAAILGSVFLLGKSPEHTFTPEVTESVSSNSWEERNSQTDSGHVMSKNLRIRHSRKTALQKILFRQ